MTWAWTLQRSGKAHAPYGGCKNSIKGIFAGDKTIKNKVVFHSTAFEMPACL